MKLLIFCLNFAPKCLDLWLIINKTKSVLGAAFFFFFFFLILYFVALEELLVNEWYYEELFENSLFDMVLKVHKLPMLCV